MQVCPVYSRSSINVSYQVSVLLWAGLLSLAGRQRKGGAVVRPKERKLPKRRGRLDMKKDPPGKV